MFNIKAFDSGSQSPPVSTTPDSPPSSDPLPTVIADISISSLSPSSGGISGGTLITITGSHFLSGVSVTIGGANCTSLSLISSTQITCLSPSGSTGVANVVIANTLDAQPEGTRTATLANGFTFIPPTLFDIYFGSQTDTKSLVLKLRYNVTDDAISLSSTSDLSSTLGSDGLRMMADGPSGNFMFAGYHSAAAIWSSLLNSNPLTLGLPLSLSGRPTTQLPNIIGGCVLPNGNLIAGSYSSQIVAEFSSSGSYLRDLPSLNYFLSDCVSTSSSTTLFVSDYDANSDEAGFVKKLTFNGVSWSVVSTLDVTTFAGHTKGTPYSLVLHTNGNLYIPPQNPMVGGVQKLIRCTNADLSACQEIGANWPQAYPAGAVEGAAQIPGSDDMLFADNTGIYRYRVADNSISLIYTFSITNHQWSRGLRIRIAP